MSSAATQRMIRLIQTMGVARARDLEQRGVSRAALARLVDAELAQRLSRGIYAASDHAVTTQHTLVQVSMRVPAATFCLLTAHAAVSGLDRVKPTADLAASVAARLLNRARRTGDDYQSLLAT